MSLRALRSLLKAESPRRECMTTGIILLVMIGDLLAPRVLLQALKNILSTKEDPWSGLVKGKIFGKLIDEARKAEGAETYEPAHVLDRIRVYV